MALEASRSLHKCNAHHAVVAFKPCGLENPEEKQNKAEEHAPKAMQIYRAVHMPYVRYTASLVSIQIPFAKRFDSGQQTVAENCGQTRTQSRGTRYERTVHENLKLAPTPDENYEPGPQLRLGIL